ncbi:hypothetical protein J6590_080088 [Homalodisca vitripennis]|nr:hypothetical protein J6590_080088 [Homalodisca vitripennis]
MSVRKVMTNISPPISNHNEIPVLLDVADRFNYFTKSTIRSFPQLDNYPITH